MPDRFYTPPFHLTHHRFKIKTKKRSGNNRVPRCALQARLTHDSPKSVVTAGADFGHEYRQRGGVCGLLIICCCFLFREMMHDHQILIARFRHEREDGVRQRFAFEANAYFERLVWPHGCHGIQDRHQFQWMPQRPVKAEVF